MNSWPVEQELQHVMIPDW